MQMPDIKFQEEYSAKLPVLALLHNLDWQFLSPTEALRLRDNKFDQGVLKDVPREKLRKHRFRFAGEEQRLMESLIEGIVTDVCSPALNEGLLTANTDVEHGRQRLETLVFATIVTGGNC